MSRRTSYGTRHLLEAELRPHELETLAEACRVAFVPRDRWHLSDAIAPLFENIAAVRLAERIRGDERRSKKDAHMVACLRLGLSENTIADRLKRWGRDVYRAA